MNPQVNFSKNYQQAVHSVEFFVAHKFNAAQDYMYTKSREKNVVAARFVAFYILSKIYGLTNSAIGDIFGFDHSSITNGLARIEEWDWAQPIEEQYRSIFPGARPVGSSRLSVEKHVEKPV